MTDFNPADVKPGDVLLVRDAHGAEITMRALTGLHRGHKFPIVRVCTLEAWPDDDQGIPWPADDVLGRFFAATVPTKPKPKGRAA